MVSNYHSTYYYHFTSFFAKNTRIFKKISKDKIAEANVIVGESLTGINNVKSFTNEPYEMNRYNQKVVRSNYLAFAMALFAVRFLFCNYLCGWIGIFYSLENAFA